MPIVTVDLDLPVETAARIAAGEVYRTGGVIRDVVTKTIVEHLRDADGQPAADAAAKTLAAVRAKPVVAASVAVVGVGALAAATVISARRRTTRDTVKRFEAAFRSYVEDARLGNLSVAVIDELDSAWSAAQMLPLSLLDVVRTSPTFLETNVAIAAFTRDLARANGAKLPERFAIEASDLDLSDYLAEQREIITKAT